MPFLFFIYVPSNLSINNLKDLVAYGKANQIRFSAASVVNTMIFALIGKQLFHTRFGSLDEFMSMERCAIPLPGQGEDVQEGALAFAEKRAPKFKGR